MRLVVQNSLEASCKVDNNIVGKISHGFVVLVGFTQGDNREIVEKMAKKFLSMRVFNDENGKTNLSLQDVNGEILSISQFTLYGDVRKGRRPSFTDALRPFEAEKLYDCFNLLIEHKHGRVSTGVFGADMKVNSENDGPFTLVLDSKELFPL